MNNDIEIIPLTWNDIVEKIKSDKPFTFVRYGDGDIQCMLRNMQNHMNCDNHMYFPSLGRKLRLSFVAAPMMMNYMVALQTKMLTDMGRQIHAFIKQKKLSRPWYYADAIHDASAEGTFFESFMELIKNDEKACYIGPKWLETVCRNFIEIPALNCWLQYERTKAKMIDMVLEEGIKKFYISASMMTKVLVFEMYEMLGDRIQQIDFGSVLDPYYGVKSRRYHAKIDQQVFWINPITERE